MTGCTVLAIGWPILGLARALAVGKTEVDTRSVTISDFIWQALVIVVFGAVGGLVCRARIRHGTPDNFQSLLRKTLHIYLVFPLLLVFPSINLYVALEPSVQWNMPPWLQVHWSALSWGTVSALLAYVFGFCAVAALASGHRWKWLLICFGASVLAAIQVYAGWESRPNLPPLGGTTYSADGVILQTTPFTCVPASAANIARLLGVQTTEAELVKLFHTTRDGTFPAQVLYGFRALGINGQKAPPGAAIGDIRPPAMLFIMADTHAVVYAGMRHGRIEIWNPSTGKSLITEPELHEIWTGHALEFTRTGN